jgi:hypothetical protein
MKFLRFLERGVNAIAFLHLNLLPREAQILAGFLIMAQ